MSGRHRAVSGTAALAAVPGAAAAAGDSMSVAAWTTISRVTGVGKIAAIGAVLGPTFFGNTYQFTNSLPNLVYYGFLAGSLFSSLLVPALVRHIDAGDRGASERVAGGFLGTTLLALLVVTPLAVAFGPLVLRVTASGHGMIGAQQEHVARLLILMFIPQVFCYGVVGTATAVMNSRRRFALAAAAPALENVGTVAVLGAVAALFGTRASVDAVPTGEVLLLGLGTTAAVALHASAQWWGARRAGVVLLPRAGWHDPEVKVIVRRALPSLAQAGLMALQTMSLLAIANRVSGGVVALQIALNFFYLAIAIGATPVALSLLPRLSRMYLADDAAAFRETLVRGFALGFFVTIPAAVGYLTLARPLARAVSFGHMAHRAGVTMLAASLAALSVAVVAQTAFMIATYASYARKDTRTPLVSMAVQAALCLSLMTVALALHGTAVLLALGLAYSLSVAAAACHLTAHVWRRVWARGGRSTARLAPSLARVVTGAAVMAGPAWLTARAVPDWIGRPLGSSLGILLAAFVGGGIFLALQAMWRTPELSWLAGGLGHVRGKIAGQTDG